MVKFPKKPRPLQPMCQTEREIVEISCLAIHKAKLDAQNGANGEISQNAMALIANVSNRK